MYVKPMGIWKSTVIKCDRRVKYCCIKKIGFGLYGPRFHEQGQEHVAGIWSIGWEERTSKEYRWDGMKRDEQGVYVLQYTLSGKGVIEVDGNSISLESG